MPEQECPPCKKGAPDWMVTFSDLMTLLMTFFVIMLSMSTITDPKFEQAVESIKQAFSGEFIFGQPTKNIISITELDPASKKVEVKEQEEDDDLTNTKEQENIEKEKYKFEMLEVIEEVVQDMMNKEVDSGVAEIEKQQERVLIRFPAEATFLSGSADLKPQMEKVLTTLADSLRGLNLSFVVNGHTDDVPINSLKFRSNWDLSGARAASVASVFQMYGGFNTTQLEIVGHADGEPLVPNDSKENRERNRRIEVFIEPGTENIDTKVFNDVLEVTGYDTTAYQIKRKADSISKEADKIDTLNKQKKDSIKKVDKQNRIENIKDKIRKFGNR